MGALAGGILALLFALLTQVLMANQVASGLALTLFGLGLSALLGQTYVGISPPRTPKLDLGPLSDIPFLGRAVFSHDALVYVAIAIVIGVWWFLKYSRAGLILRAVGGETTTRHTGWATTSNACARWRSCSAAPAPGWAALTCR